MTTTYTKLFKYTPLVLSLFVTACNTTPSLKTEKQLSSSLLEKTNTEMSKQSVRSKSTTTNNLLFIIDSSTSLKNNYIDENGSNTKSKFLKEKQLLSQINQQLPNYRVNSGLRQFGQGKCTAWQSSKLLQQIQPHNTVAFQDAINQLTCASGGSPADAALQSALTDIEKTHDNKAIIFLSDGQFALKSAVKAVRKIKEQYGSKTCVYPIWVGNKDDNDSYLNLKKLNASSCCGFTTKAKDLQDKNSINNYLSSITNNFGSPWDNDCDGVINEQPDECPETPLDSTVDIRGCTLDSDNDGIHNAYDNCPQTPLSANVDQYGCWLIYPILFDTNKNIIKAHNFNHLNEVIRVMKINPHYSFRLMDILMTLLVLTIM